MDADTYQRDIAHIIAAVRMIFAMGGRRSAGLGWLRCPIQCQVVKETAIHPFKAAPEIYGNPLISRKR